MTRKKAVDTTPPDSEVTPEVKPDPPPTVKALEPPASHLTHEFTKESGPTHESILPPLGLLLILPGRGFGLRVRSDGRVYIDGEEVVQDVSIRIKHDRCTVTGQQTGQSAVFSAHVRE